jgi:hypothetical protein
MNVTPSGRSRCAQILGHALIIQCAAFELSGCGTSLGAADERRFPATTGTSPGSRDPNPHEQLKWTTSVSSPRPIRFCKDTDLGDHAATVVDLEVIPGRVLKARIEHEDSCGPPAFDFCWNGVELESAPGQVFLSLVRMSVPPRCPGRRTHVEHFDASLLFERLQGTVKVGSRTASVLMTFPVQ